MTTFTGGSSPFTVGEATEKDNLDIPFNNTKALKEGDATAALDRLTLDDSSPAVSPSGDLSLSFDGDQVEVSKNGGAWEQFQTLRAMAKVTHSGSPSLVRDYNVATISDLGPGRTRLNFSNALPNANYVCSGSVTGGAQYVVFYQSPLTTSVEVLTENSLATDTDRDYHAAVNDHWDAA